MRPLIISLTALAIALSAQPGRAFTPAAAAAPVVSPQELARAVAIPYRQFTLPNGLRVVVHEDHKAPVVAVSIWYNVGSKDEPAGRTGFAHLFEHLMFNGSENARGDYFAPMQRVGATQLNGSTWFDRTNYYETVPRAALETALFMESDRMGHLLGAVTQQVLDNQRGVVQNEKRQGDNQPYGMVQYRELETLFPTDHPYHHNTIGSMADLDAATLDTVGQWFRGHYGPNNAVLGLAGDITPAEAEALVARYFGGIPRGPENHPAQANVPTLPQRRDDVMHDHVATTRLYREWLVPGQLDDVVVPLDVAAGVLGGLGSSRLDNALVRGDRSAVFVNAGVQQFQRVSFFRVQVDVRPGVDVEQVSRRLDQIVADYLRDGPTADEVRRYATATIAGNMRALDQVGGGGGQAAILASGLLYANDPDFFRRRLAQTAAVTPAEVRAAMQRWLTRPVWALRIEPGDREPYQESVHARAGAVAGETGQQPRFYRDADALAAGTVAAAPRTADVDRSHFPAVGTIADLHFPAVEHARLSNGIEISFARRPSLPMVQVAVEFDAGAAADRQDRAGLQKFMTDLMPEGTNSLDTVHVRERLEGLGAQLTPNVTMDRTTLTLNALHGNLTPSLDLLADVLRNPSFAPGDLDRLRNQRLAEIAGEMTQPVAIALRTAPAILFGDHYPYGVPLTGNGTADAVRALTREEIVAAHDAWIRPDNARIFVTGDTSLAEIVPLLEARFGAWHAPATARGVKDFSGEIPAAHERIVLVDRPQSPQSLILGGLVLSADGTADLEPLDQANQVLGAGFMSRINMDLREDKSWSYGSRGVVYRYEHRVPYLIFAPVQADHSGDAVAAMRSDIRQFLTSAGVTAEELERTINGSIRQLPGQFETAQAVLGGMEQNALYRRPDDYFSTVASRYRAMTAPQLDQSARAMIDPDRIIWVVVGDASRVRPQLEQLHLPIEVVPAR